MTTNRHAGRRTLLQMGTAAAAALALPARARDAAKPRPAETVSAPEDLMREHAVLDRLMLVYENGLRRLNHGEDIDPAVFGRSAEIVQAFTHDYHEKAEEEMIFPVFRKGGRMVDLLNVLTAQHEAGRRLTQRIAAAAPQARVSERREAMGRDIQAFVAMYRPHEARESTDLFPTLRQLVTDAQYWDLAEEMEKRERRTFGADGFEKMVKKVAEIEALIGIRDIDVFTPRG